MSKCLENRMETMPPQKMGLLAELFSTWMTPYMWKAYKTGIRATDVPALRPVDTCEHNVKKLKILWQEEICRHGLDGASFQLVVWKFVRKRILLSTLLVAIHYIFGFISPAIMLRNLLLYANSNDGTIWDGLKWTALLVTSDICRSIFLNLFWLVSFRTSLKLKSAYTAMLYGKLVSLNNLDNKNSGQVINMFSNDSKKLNDIIVFGPLIVGGPIVLICGIIYILCFFGASVLTGMLVFLLFYPIQYAISYASGYSRTKCVRFSDMRLKFIQEILNSIKLIKMYTWEEYFVTKIFDMRRKEQGWLRKTAYCQSIGLSLALSIPAIATIITFTTHLSTGANLTAAQAFSIFALFGNLMKQALSGVRHSTRSFIEVRIAFNRFKDLMRLENNTSPILEPILKSRAVSINVATFIRDGSAGTRSKSTATAHGGDPEELKNLTHDFLRTEVLKDITFEANKGHLIGICGTVGSGKSSLLLAILGQLQATNGHVRRDGSCAYVGPEAWILNATLKENVLFGQEFNHNRYYLALSVCGLIEDLKGFPGEDETEIGERGVNLSGGQKQKVALARALYSNRDIYLLDDPLSAIDANMAASIFKNLVLKALSEKTVILVTNHIRYLDQCDDIYLLHDGQILEHGTHHNLLRLDREYAAMVRKNALTGSGGNGSKRLSIDSTSSTDPSPETPEANGDCVEDEPKSKTGHKLTVEEKLQTGSIKFATFNTYIRAGGGYLAAMLVLMSVLTNVLSTDFSSWWLAIWLKAGAGNTSVTIGNETVISENINDNPDFWYYQTIYCLCIVAILGTGLLRGTAVIACTLKASTRFHDDAVQRTISSTTSFLETNLSGRIHNLFGHDIDEVDNRLPLSLESVIQNVLVCLSSILTICAVFPWFIVPVVVLGIVFISLGVIFRAAMRDFKRIENKLRSPLLSFLNTTIQGLNTIQAFDKNLLFVRRFQKLADENHSHAFMGNIAVRWLAIRFDSFTHTATCVTAIFVVLFKGDVSPALAGLALANCIKFSGLLQFTVRIISELELRFISVERIKEYLYGPGTEDNTFSVKPNSDWPANGSIVFDEVSMKYGEDLPLVLNGVSFAIEKGEKIGIVGSSGSGKTSIVNALFRLVEISAGRITIDGVDVSQVDLKLLRSKLSIVPQDPLLFDGTFRSNIDPFLEYPDIAIWEVLEKTQLKTKVQAFPEKLNAAIGGKLSSGEKQLLCLARALLRGNKILILDEATAAIDPETEVLIQNIMKQEFSKHTVLMIAHRLNTVLSCNRILVMKDGGILEEGSSESLLANGKSEFSKMVAAQKG